MCGRPSCFLFFFLLAREDQGTRSGSRLFEGESCSVPLELELHIRKSVEGFNCYPAIKIPAAVASTTMAPLTTATYPTIGGFFSRG
jgi:hypothetical protein